MPMVILFKRKEAARNWVYDKIPIGIKVQYVSLRPYQNTPL
jgi:hypothetical protein